MKKIAKWIRHNQGIFAATLLSVGVLVWTYGCESQVVSLIEPGKLVSRDELKLEIEAETQRLEAELEILLKSAGLKMQQLDRADAIKQKLSEFAAISAQTGSVNPIGVVTLLGSIIGAGAVVDNRIKDKVIKNRPLKGK